MVTRIDIGGSNAWGDAESAEQRLHEADLKEEQSHLQVRASTPGGMPGKWRLHPSCLRQWD